MRDEEDGDDGTTTSGEDINGPDKDAEQDDGIFDEEKDVDWDAVWGSGGSEVNKWVSGGSDGDKEKWLLGVEDKEEAS